MGCAHVPAMAQKQHDDDAPSMSDRFRAASDRVTHAVGTPWALVLAVLVVVAWAITGPIFHFSDTWQLVINTGTTIVTFLMVFVIQTSQNRDAKALHLKLDELIRATPRARNALMNEEFETEARMRADEAEARRQGDRAQRAADRATGASARSSASRKGDDPAAKESGSAR
jgi:low affinity Fe/Cu permease